MKNKLLPLLGGLLLGCLAHAYASGPYADPSYESWGNNWRTRAVATSTDTVVVISTPVAHSGLETSDPWRARHITNIGGDELVLYPNNSSFTIFESTRGVHLSSFTSTNAGGEAPYPRAVWIYGNALIYGIWNTGGTEANTGAIVNEFYDKR